MRSFNEDLKTGKAAEKDILSTLKKTLDDKQIEIVPGMYSKFDYESPSRRIELKCRTNSSTKYNTTMISLSKVYDAENYDGDYYFVFKFTDKLMMIEFDEKQFKKFERNIIVRKDRGLDESNTYVMLPIK